MLLSSRIKRFMAKGLKAAAITTAVVAAGMIGLHAVRANAAEKQNCDANAVVWCGATSVSSLQSKYGHGDTVNSAASIQHIYNSPFFKISTSDITSMGTYEVEGSVKSNGDVYAGDTLVATNAWTAGRLNISGSTKESYLGTTFYVRHPSVSFLQGSLTAMVVMRDGVFQFAILHSCGNPVIATPKKPAYTILKQVRAGTSGAYSSSVTVKSGSTVSYQITVSSTGAVPAVNVNVRDTLPAGITYTAGTLQENGVAVSSTNASKFFSTGVVVPSIKNGSKVVFTFTAKAGTVIDTSDSCKPATGLNNEGFISSPGLPNEQSGAKVNTTCTPVVALSCDNLIPTPGDIDKTTGNQAYKFVATASVKNATITGYVFTFGDGKSQPVTTSATSANASHTYAPGTYTASVTVAATANGKNYTATGPKCQVPITVSQAPMAACVDLKAFVTDRTKVALVATASADNGATISGYDFVVKNSAGTTVANPSVTTTAKTATANINLATAGNYSAQVTANTSLGPKTSNGCKTTFTISQAPVATCDNLDAVVTDRTKVALNATATAQNGATISSYNFVVKNSAGTTVQSPVVTTTAGTATANITVATPGDYTAQVTVSTSEGPKTSEACKAKFSINAAPAAACISLKPDQIDRTNFTLNATANADNGATISGYDFTVKNSASAVVASKTVTTTAETASADVALTDEGTYTAQVTVNTSLGPKTGPQCTAIIKVKPAPKPNVTITKFVDHLKREQVNVNQNFVYEVKVTNTGETDLTNVVVTDPAPQGVMMISTDLGTISGNALNYTIPSLKVSASVTFNITAKVTDFIEGDIVNTACVNAPEVNPDQPEKADACDTATVTVTPPSKNPNITIVKTVDGKKQEAVGINQQFTYKLVITNTGEIDLTNVVVTDPAPQGVTMLDTDQGTIDSNALSLTLPSLKIGESATVNITAKVAVLVDGNIVNTACVNAPEVNPDQPDKTDACDTATVTVTPPELPNTGAGNVIGLFAGVVVAGAIGHRFFLGRKLGRQG
ncbi:MAG TPA: PKD domain-containing protein [Candidatus Saccharimonadales bacterium]|nr:PKD domain-containing protein [Candidatus Saccharimonadales bacterium]